MFDCTTESCQFENQSPHANYSNPPKSADRIPTEVADIQSHCSRTLVNRSISYTIKGLLYVIGKGGRYLHIIAFLSGVISVLPTYLSILESIHSVTLFWEDFKAESKVEPW